MSTLVVGHLQRRSCCSSSAASSLSVSSVACGRRWARNRLRRSPPCRAAGRTGQRHQRRARVRQLLLALRLLEEHVARPLHLDQLRALEQPGHKAPPAAAVADNLAKEQPAHAVGHGEQPLHPRLHAAVDVLVRPPVLERNVPRLVDERCAAHERCEVPAVCEREARHLREEECGARLRAGRATSGSASARRP